MMLWNTVDPSNEVNQEAMEHKFLKWENFLKE
jgi:hypothetical protein